MCQTRVVTHFVLPGNALPSALWRDSTRPLPVDLDTRVSIRVILQRIFNISKLLSPSTAFVLLCPHSFTPATSATVLGSLRHRTKSLHASTSIHGGVEHHSSCCTCCLSSSRRRLDSHRSVVCRLSSFVTLFQNRVFPLNHSCYYHTSTSTEYYNLMVSTSLALVHSV